MFHQVHSSPMNDGRTTKENIQNGIPIVILFRRVYYLLICLCKSWRGEQEMLALFCVYLSNYICQHVTVMTQWKEFNELTLKREVDLLKCLESSHKKDGWTFWVSKPQLVTSNNVNISTLRDIENKKYKVEIERKISVDEIIEATLSYSKRR